MTYKIEHPRTSKSFGIDHALPLSFTRSSTLGIKFNRIVCVIRGISGQRIRTNADRVSATTVRLLTTRETKDEPRKSPPLLNHGFLRSRLMRFRQVSTAHAGTDPSSKRMAIRTCDQRLPWRGRGSAATGTGDRWTLCSNTRERRCPKTTPAL